MTEIAEQVIDAVFLQEFFGGAEENLDQLEQALIRLETLTTSTADRELLGQLVTLVQELKDGAGLLGLAKFAGLAAAGEPVLRALETGRTKPTTAVLDGLLQMTEALKLLLVVLKAQGDETAVNTDEITRELSQLAQAEPETVAALPKPVEQPVTGKGAATVLRAMRPVGLADVRVGPLLKRRAVMVDMPQLERRANSERRATERRLSERREGRSKL